MDLILSKNLEHHLIEIKSSDRVDEDEVRKLARLAQDFKKVKSIFYLSNDKNSSQINGVKCLYWKDFLKSFNNL